MTRLTGAVSRYWFYGVLAFAVIAAWQVSVTPETMVNPLLTERIYLFDFGVFLPLLYFWFLRRTVAVKAAAIRAFALASAGIAYAAWLMPDGMGQLLPFLSWLRWVALPLIILIELAAFVAVMRYVYGSDPKEEELVAQGLPPVLARLLLMEARFWKRVFAFLAGGKE